MREINTPLTIKETRGLLRSPALCVALDSNNVIVGHNNVPVEAGLCNDDACSSVSAMVDFMWNSTNDFANLRAGLADPIALGVRDASGGNPQAGQTFFKPLLKEKMPNLMQPVTAAGSGTDPKPYRPDITSPNAWFSRQDSIRTGLGLSEVMASI